MCKVANCIPNIKPTCNIKLASIAAMVSAGCNNTLLLRSDGCAVAVGSNKDGQCDIPPLDEGEAYIQISAGEGHTVLLRSDGCAVAIGDNFILGQCDIPPLDNGISADATAWHRINSQGWIRDLSGWGYSSSSWAAVACGVH